MPTHTFIAETANEAVERIRAELGPSAVVLSVRKLPRTGFSRLAGQLPFGEYPGGVAELRVAYPPETVAGEATVYFYTRPDPGRAARATVDIDPSRCTEVQLMTTDLSIDAGVPDAS